VEPGTNIIGDMPLKSALDVVAWVVNQRILSNGNKSGTCSPIIRYIKRSRRDILISIEFSIETPHKSLIQANGFKTLFARINETFANEPAVSNASPKAHEFIPL
jgi:hypothetical protein